MIEQSLSDQRIIDCLNSDYGIKVARLIFLPKFFYFFILNTYFRKERN